MLRQHLFRLIPIFILLLLATACGGLAGEIEIVATSAPQTASTSDIEQRIPISEPITIPDVRNGQRIFAENCTQCHGVTGDGGGELVQSGEVPRMPSFLEASYVREQTPALYYDMITNGNLINLMPPWSQALSEEERWDVAMYVYTLQYSPEQVLQGADLYPDASEAFSLESDAALLSEIGVESATADDAAWAAIAYRRLRSLKNYSLLTNQEIVGLLDDAPPPTFMTFTGSVSNMTDGFDLPENLEVILRYGNFADGFTTETTTIDANNIYVFDNIPYVEDAFYFTAAIYSDIPFQSEVLVPNQLAALNELPLNITERTEDASDISISNINIIIDRTTVDGVGSGIIFQQTYTYVNNSDRTLYRLPQEQDLAVSLLIQLPPGALILNDPENPRFIIAQDFYSLIDTNPVYPGEHVVEALYFLPHTEGDAIIDLAMNNSFNGTLDIVVAVPSLTVSGDAIEFVNEETIQNASGNVIVKNYQAGYAIPSGDSLVFTVSGTLFASQITSENTDIITGNFLIPVLAIVIALFIIAIIGLTMLRQQDKNANRNQAEIDRLLAQISQIETLHDKGEINHDVFQRQRKELKEKLATLMKSSTVNE
ncbi:MAG: cytochrome c [Anaerolineae bacterium]|nr:cytochrome c [Anaerolineae bacterium]MDQ7034494.1 cytochrome c [Anaerolineae bacterium]